MSHEIDKRELDNYLTREPDGYSAAEEDAYEDGYQSALKKVGEYIRANSDGTPHFIAQLCDALLRGEMPTS